MNIEKKTAECMHKNVEKKTAVIFFIECFYPFLLDFVAVNTLTRRNYTVYNNPSEF
jgi:hypothetical protein